MGHIAQYYAGSTPVIRNNGAADVKDFLRLMRPIAEPTVPIKTRRQQCIAAQSRMPSSVEGHSEATNNQH